MSVETFLAAAAIKAKKAGIIGLVSLPVVGAEVTAINAAYPECDGNGHKIVRIDTSQYNPLINPCQESMRHYVDATTGKDVRCASGTPQSLVQVQDKAAEIKGLTHSFCILSSDDRKRQADHDKQNMYVPKDSPNFGHTLNYSFTM